MARQGDGIWLLAAGSLLVHCGVIALLSRFAPPTNRGTVSVAQALPADALKKMQIEPMPEPPPTPVERPDEDVLGEKSGDGESIARVDLPDVQVSPEVYDFEQAWTRQQPAVQTPAQAEMNAKRQADASREAALVPSGLETPLPAMSPKRIDAGKTTLEMPPVEMPPKVPPEVSPEARPPTEQTPTETQTSPDETPSDGKAKEGDQEGADQATAKAAETQRASETPSPQGESDLDAFAKVEGADFTRGGIKAREGREVKLVRPRVDLSFRVDATGLFAKKITMVFLIETDETGRPRNVTLIESSGSRSVDESVRLAMFDSWFGGKMPDKFPFTITFH